MENYMITYKGKKYDVESFMTKFNVGDEETALKYMQQLVKNAKATVYSKTSEEDELIADLEADLEFDEVITAIEEEEKSVAKSNRDKKAEDVDLVSMALVFKSSSEAAKAENWVNSLGIENTEISLKKGEIKLIIREITPSEYTKIATRYKAEKAINNTVDFASKAINGTTDAINYGMTNVVAPTAKIAGQASINLGKGVVQTTLKAGAGIINASSKAIDDTKKDLATDTELLKAKKELKDAKNKALGFFKKKLGMNKKGSGIELL